MYTFYYRLNDGKYCLCKQGWVNKDRAIKVAEDLISMGAVEMYQICSYRTDYEYECLQEMVYCLNHEEVRRQNFNELI